MNKELKALTEIQIMLDTLIYLVEDIFAANNEPIKETVKRAKRASKQILKIETTLKNHEQDQKKLKAFEVIKEKRVNVDHLIYYIMCDTKNNGMGLHWYNREIDYEYKELTQEEFDLLKEVLK